MADPKVELNPTTIGFVDTSPTVSQRTPVTAANPLPVTGGGTAAAPSIVRNAEPATNPFTRVQVNISTATTTHIIAGTAAQIIKVYRVFLNFAANQTLDIQTTTGSATLVGGPMTFGAGGSLVLDFEGELWFASLSADGIDLVTTTTGVVRGFIDYIKS